MTPSNQTAAVGGRGRLPTSEQLNKLWARTKGEAWEPECGLRHPFVAALIDGGWVKICTMRCGFEAFDTGLNWSDAARAYFAALQQAEAGDHE
jgi:hypothetical protein